ncbi:MAG: hypothetical protein K2K57_03670 [Oscillospiraceae bacterium]|nr:hypothetical protein [Oscillospiraceae bacterium]
MNKEKPEIVLKRQTLIAWARLMLKEKKISQDKCNKMIARFEKITS